MTGQKSDELGSVMSSAFFNGSLLTGISDLLEAGGSGLIGTDLVSSSTVSAVLFNRFLDYGSSFVSGIGSSVTLVRPRFLEVS